MIRAYPPDNQPTVEQVVAEIATDSMGLSTGFTQLDNMIRGLHRKELVIIGGRSSIGKSSLMVDIALNVNCPVAIFSLEMSYKTLVERMVSNITATNHHFMKLGHIPVPPIDKLLMKDITILDNPYITPVLFKNQVKELKEQFNIGCVFLDYLQLIRPDFSGGNLTQDLDYICQNIKAVGKEYDVAVVMLSQLNREVERRENHQPRLSDIRSSGGIEQTADVVILLHRPDYYMINEIDVESDDGGEAYLIVAKSRNTPVGKISVVWLSEQMSFKEIKQETF